MLGLLASGQANAEIGAALGVSVHTVERHVANIFVKIGVRNRAEADGLIAAAWPGDDADRARSGRRDAEYIVSVMSGPAPGASIGGTTTQSGGPP